MDEKRHRGSAGEVFLAFLRMGCLSFGGPVAHLGYFREEFVARRRWIDDAGYGAYIALGQLLPGPASSQVGLCLGLHRAGWLGGLAAWVGFTLPSALIMLALALAVVKFEALGEAGWIQGLKLVAVAVVAQAVWRMGESLCPDRERRILALAGAILALLLGGLAGQLSAILLGALAGRFFLMKRIALEPIAGEAVFSASRRTSAILGLAAVGLLLVLPILAWLTGDFWLRLIEGFYRSGALVFGGGHVVLPLLEEVVVPSGWMDHDRFLAGYGAAQALPGPLFALSAYLGGVAAAEAPLLGGLLALGALFLPGALLVAALLPVWHGLQQRPVVTALIAGINAAVVGLLLSALYDPVFVSAVKSPLDAALAIAAIGLTSLLRLPVWALVVGYAVLGWALY